MTRNRATLTRKWGPAGHPGHAGGRPGGRLGGLGLSGDIDPPAGGRGCQMGCQWTRPGAARATGPGRCHWQLPGASGGDSDSESAPEKVTVTSLPVARGPGRPRGRPAGPQLLEAQPGSREGAASGGPLATMDSGHPRMLSRSRRSKEKELPPVNTALIPSRSGYLLLCCCLIMPAPEGTPKQLLKQACSNYNSNPKPVSFPAES